MASRLHMLIAVALLAVAAIAQPPPPVDLVQSATPEKVAPGLACAYYESGPWVWWENLPDFGKLKPVRTSTVTSVGIPPRVRDDGIGLVFTGYLNVPAAGDYVLYLTSDDGSRLYLDDLVVIDNDGQHGAQEVTNAVYFSKGYHRLRLLFFEMAGEQALALEWEGPDIPRQQVPASALCQ